MARLDLDKFDPKTLAGRFRETSLVNRVAILAGILWAVLVLSYGGGYFGGAGGGQARGTVFLDAVFFLVALTLPLGLITLAAWLAAELARQRAAVAELVAAAGPLAEALAETRASLREDGPLTPRAVERVVRTAVAEAQAELRRDLDSVIRGAINGSVGNRFAELAAAQQRLERLLAAPAGAAAAPAPGTSKAPEVEVRQPAPPDIPAEAEEELGLEDLLRAFDFPKDAEDREGFRALGRALRHQDLAQMLQAAEDVMNLLAQEGVYMDDLAPEPPSPAVWRAFAEGRRGSEVETFGGIRDERALAVVRKLMESNSIFRDTAHFFQRRFDAVLRDLATRLDDAALTRLADTRSARAFMLSARASGAFG